jgi:PAS domain S-box-containing protein
MSNPNPDSHTAFKILVVAGDTISERSLAVILKAAGYQALVAGFGNALDVLAKEDPAIALIDLTKDPDSGVETVRKIKMRSPGTACLVLKDRLSHRPAIQAVELGAYLYVSKPLDAEQLLLVIRRAIEQQETAGTRGETDERCRVFMDNIKLSIALFNRDGVFLTANLAAAHRLGSTPDAIVGKSLLELRPDIADSHLARIRQVMDSGIGMVSGPEKGAAKAGHPLLATFDPIRNAKARVTGVQVVEYSSNEG